MEVKKLVDSLSQRGITLAAVGKKLVVESKKSVVPGIMATIAIEEKRLLEYLKFAHKNESTGTTPLTTSPKPLLDTTPASPQPTDKPDANVDYLKALGERLEALNALADALPAEKRAAALNALSSYRCNRQRVDTATADQLRAEAKAFRFCARRWRHGLPGNPVDFLPPPVPAASNAVDSAQGST